MYLKLGFEPTTPGSPLEGALMVRIELTNKSTHRPYWFLRRSPGFVIGLYIFLCPFQSRGKGSLGREQAVKTLLWPMMICHRGIVITMRLVDLWQCDGGPRTFPACGAFYFIGIFRQFQKTGNQHQPASVSLSQTQPTKNSPNQPQPSEISQNQQNPTKISQNQSKISQNPTKISQNQSKPVKTSKNQ